MTDNHAHLQKAAPLPADLPECPAPGKVFPSPLGWSAQGRLLVVAAAAALLWLSVGWAMGWFQ